MPKKTKHLFQSKIFWTNTLMILISVFQLFTETYTIDPNLVVMIFGTLNIFLRTITTKPIK